MNHEQEDFLRDGSIFDCHARLHEMLAGMRVTDSPCGRLLPQLFLDGQTTRDVTEDTLGPAGEAARETRLQWLTENSQTYSKSQQQEVSRHFCDDVPCGEIAVGLWFVAITLIFAVIGLNLLARRK